MKKFLISVTIALLAFGCNSYDDTAILDRLESLENRVAALEALNSQVQELHNLMVALQNNVYVTNVSEVTSGGVVIGYCITFSDNTSVEILNGADGADGADGSVVSIAQYTDGLYYWTIDGEFTDPMLRVDGVTPVFDIDDEGYLRVSYDNGVTWTVLGKTSASVEANFTLTYDDDYLYITFTDDNSQIRIPLEKEFTLTILASSMGVAAGQTIEIPYVLTNADETVIVETLSENGYTASVVQSSYSEGVIKVTAPNPVVDGKVLVFANKGDKTCMRALYFEEGVFTMTTVAYEASADGEKLTIDFETNYTYTVEVPAEYASWITVAETKAAVADYVYIYVLFNETTERRTGYVNFLRASDGETLQTITISQDASDEYKIRALFGIQPTTDKPFGFTTSANRTMAVVGDYLIVSNSSDYTAMPVYDRWTGDWLPNVKVNTDGIDSGLSFHAIANDDADHLVAVAFVSVAGSTEGVTVKGYAWLNGIDQAPTNIISADLATTFADLLSANASVTTYDLFRTISVYGDLSSGYATIGTICRLKYRPAFLQFIDGVMQSSAFVEWPSGGNASFNNGSKAVPISADFDNFEYFMCSANSNQVFTYVYNSTATIFSAPSSHWWLGGSLGIDAIDVNGNVLFAVQSGNGTYYRLYVSELGSSITSSSLANGFLFDSREGDLSGTANIPGSGYGVSGMSSPYAFDGTSTVLGSNGNSTGDVIFATGNNAVQVYMLVTDQSLIGYNIPLSKLSQ